MIGEFQGVDISIGKLMIYAVAAGIDPKNVLAVFLDASTNNEKLLKDPLYLVNRYPRIYGDKYYAMVDKFVKNAHQLFPEVMCILKILDEQMLIKF